MRPLLDTVRDQGCRCDDASQLTPPQELVAMTEHKDLFHLEEGLRKSLQLHPSLLDRLREKEARKRGKSNGHKHRNGILQYQSTSHISVYA